ncbi:PucR family transcriptional regulator [Sporosarcina sp. P19]|uniref:PucR family transcriptional regulator n=1 Tax=Sporosarcina sp. P19 TaxID=2048258 RepID=UPI000C16B84E|nr:PucR family transcriptional regulator ligand-binding domain-containing protein [Sporosarcina sp. P19]PIC77054.1 PucR family transcriptional regulator [Sporosarcina sp. P19]
MNELSLTVKDVLARETFKHAKVIAGRNGLDRQVRWSHVLEVSEFSSLVNGGEIILTTGIHLQLDSATQLKYIKQLIELDVACLCVEIGYYVSEIQQDIITLADAQQFPIVVFEKAVKFVDISQDLHTVIINRHYEMLSKLDTLSRRFNQLSLMPNGILKILHELHSLFNQHVLFISDEAKSYYYPLESTSWKHSIKEFLSEKPTQKLDQDIYIVDDQPFALFSINGLGQALGYLCLHLPQETADEFAFLILDRASLAIAQILLRNRTIQERNQFNEDEFVRNLLHGRPVEQEDIQSYLPTKSPNTHYRIFVIQLDTNESTIDENSWEEIRLQQSMMIRSVFKRHSFFPAISVTRNEITIIASFIASGKHVKDINHFTQVAEQLTGMDDNTFFNEREYKFGISLVHHNHSQIREGYKEAKRVAELKQKFAFESDFYDDLGIYRLLLLLNEQGDLEHYVDDYLQDLMDYDKKTGGNLFETLRIYLECGGSKKETADRLFIVRQTLYHRLEKIESIMGENFMSPLNRIALEVAIMAKKVLV